MNHASLFSGIGAPELAAEWMGWKNIFHCEIEAFPRKVLKYYWPNTRSYEDIRQTNFSVHRGQIDVLTGGFPCQPFSLAGKRRGTTDDRNLWPEMFRVIQEVQPRWVVAENVFGIVNWSGGLVFEQVISDLENEGYEVQPFILPATAVNAPHRRDRTFFVAHNNKRNRTENRFQTGGQKHMDGNERVCNNAHANKRTAQPPRKGERTDKERGKNANEPQKRGEQAEQHTGCRNVLRDVANANCSGFQAARAKQPTAGVEQYGEMDDVTNPTNSRCQQSNKKMEGKPPKQPDNIRFQQNNSNPCSQGRKGSKRTEASGQRNRQETFRPASESFEIPTWDNWPTQPPVRSRNDGFSRQLVRYISKELQHEISKTSEENRIKDLSKVWEKVSQEEVWEKVRGLYSLESKEILLQTMQLYSTSFKGQVKLSPFSEKVSKKPMRILQEYGEFRYTPQGRKLEKQRQEKYSDSLSFLPHEVALAAGIYTRAMAEFETWLRKESIKAYGNAIVPQVIFQIFKTIEKYENTKKQNTTV